MLTPGHFLPLHLLSMAAPKTTLQKCLQGIKEGFLALLSFLLLELTPTLYGSATLFIFCCGE